MDRFRFETFLLDCGDRQLKREGSPVELNARYLDALALLVREQGRLVSKDRFLDEVWRGVPVTDEALTQCIKTLRRQLGDDASRPRFIETVPKHGYRFIAEVERDGGSSPAVPEVPAPSQVSHRPLWQTSMLLGAAGTIGGGVAGLLGGLFYGFVGASQPLSPGPGAASVLLVLVCLTIAAALIGAAGVAFGIAVSRILVGRICAWSIAGGAVGGLAVGGFAKLLGLDAFNLLFGRSPGDITGGVEGLLLGAAVGLSAWLAVRRTGPRALRRGVAGAAIVTGAVGMLIPAIGGRLMGGSLALLAEVFPDSRLRFDQLGALLGESGFGPLTQIATGGMEGALFGACIVAALLIARRNLGLDS